MKRPVQIVAVNIAHREVEDMVEFTSVYALMYAILPNVTGEELHTFLKKEYPEHKEFKDGRGFMEFDIKYKISPLQGQLAEDFFEELKEKKIMEYCPWMNALSADEI